MGTSTIIPFSTGTEAINWYANNCEACTKAYFPKEGKDYPSDATMRKYCTSGKECKLKYYLDLAFITSELPMKIAAQIGTTPYGLKENCMLFTDNTDDGYKASKRPTPDTTPDNQMVLPYAWDDIAQQRIWEHEATC